MDSKVLVVTGATGFQGRSFIGWFQELFPAWSIRGLTRAPLSGNAMALKSTGVDTVKADFDDLDSLKAGFAGADYIFAFTDFASIMRGPQVMGKFQKGELDVTPGVGSSKIEFQHGKHIAEAAATVPSLQRLVWSA